MKSNLLFVSLLAFVFSFPSFAQETKLNSFENIDMTFYLEAAPTIEDVGFNNPKSSWKVDYEVYLTDFAELEKLGKCGFVEGRSIKNCSNFTDKKLDKKIKKLAHRIAKGKFSQKQLVTEANRKILRNIVLTPKALEIFQESAKTYEKNPILIVYVRSKVSTKNSAGTKLKQKYNTEGLQWLKIYNADKSIEYRDLSKVTFRLEVQKDKDNSLKLRVGYVHFG